MRSILKTASFVLIALATTAFSPVLKVADRDTCTSFRDWTEMDPLSPDDHWHTGNLSFSPEMQFPDGEWRDEGNVSPTGDSHNSFDAEYTLNAHGHTQLCGS